MFIAVHGLIRTANITPIIWKRHASHFITTPIFYVNSSPHIGHVHTLFLADALNIYSKLKLGTDDTILSTGTDEHGIKVQTAAQANNMSCSDFCDLNAAKFFSLFKQYETSVTDFIRTTEGRHELSVQTIWKNLDKNGFIYKSSYSGWYCVSDEVFVPETQVTTREIDGQIERIDANENKLVWSSEENYMFKLSQVEDHIVQWLMRDQPIIPQKFNEELLKQLEKSRIGDISISRPKSRLQWGIEVPGDSSQTIYVWLDALVNYLTVAGYPCDFGSMRRWPIDVQVLGKDIIKFHAVYWPAFLLALSMPLPRKLICHSHWLVDSHKMSKSRGNVIDPCDENRRLTLEGLRFYLLRSATTHSDTDYSCEQALRRVNAELADTYGNLLSRSCAPAINPTNAIPTNILPSNKSAAMEELQERLSGLSEVCANHYEVADFYKGVDDIMATLRLNNRIYQEAEPWKLVRELDNNPQSRVTYHNLQALTFETLRICSILLQPIIPRLSQVALDRMDIKNRLWRDANINLSSDDSQEARRPMRCHTSPVIFRRIKG